MQQHKFRVLAYCILAVVFFFLLTVFMTRIPSSPTSGNNLNKDCTPELAKPAPSDPWNFQTDDFCPDVRATYDPHLIKDYLAKRRQFYYELTDAPNKTLPEWSGNIYEEWTPMHKFYNLLGPIVDLCPRGVEEYGKEKRLCAPPIDDPACVVMSIGGNNQWAFEQAVASRTKCQVHTFDCTLDMQVPLELGERVKAWNVCIAQRKFSYIINNRTQNFITWSDMLQMINLTGPPTILKMDVEGYEFGVFRSIITALHGYPSQIALELHFGTLKDTRDAYLFVDLLWKAGYAVIARVDNQWCSSCTDVLLKRIFCYN